MMRDEMFAEPWLDVRPRPGSADPELGLRGSSRPPDPASYTEHATCMGVSSPPDPMPSRTPTTSAAPLVGSLFYLVLVGLVAVATIGVLFGVGFSLLGQHRKDTIADAGTRESPHPDGGAARADRESPPAQRESAASGSAALTAPPGSPLTQPGAMPEVPVAEQGKAAKSPSPGGSSSQLPARTALKPEPASGSGGSSASPGSSASATPLASSAPFSAMDVPPSGATRRRPTRDGRGHHGQTASRYSHPRSGHGASTLTPPQAAQAKPFDSLLTVLTERSEATLTPPREQ